METGHARKNIEKAFAQYEMAVKLRPKYSAKEPVKLITISRQIGAGGHEITEKLGSKLGCTVWGREILDVLASQSGGDYQARIFESLDEKTQGTIAELVSDFLGQVATHTYHYLLPKAIFTIAQNDAIFLGRGANLILPQAFHVRITASMKTRIQRIMDREHLDRAAAMEIIRESDRVAHDAEIRARAHRDELADPAHEQVADRGRLTAGHHSPLWSRTMAANLPAFKARADASISGAR